MLRHFVARVVACRHVFPSLLGKLKQICRRLQHAKGREVREQGVGNPLEVIQKYQISHNGPIFDFLHRDEVDTRGRYSGDVGSPQLLALDWSWSA